MNSKTIMNLFALVFAGLLLTGCGSNDYDDGDYSADSGFGEGDDSGLYVESAEGYADSGAGDAYVEEQNTASSANLASVFYFGYDQATLTRQSREALDAQIAVLKDTVGTIRLEGHADERGTREYNVALGERRALAVADYLAINGIPRYRIETVSYGEERPVAFGQDEDSWSLNRRVELK